MPEFKVYLTQYVEEIATMVIDAVDEKTARDIALKDSAAAGWQPGDDVLEVEVYKVEDDAGLIVWER